MTKISLLRSQLKVFDFAATYQVERNSSIKVKLLALHHFQTGKEISAIADMILATEKSVSHWIKRFIKFDYEGLIVRKGRGRKPRLPVTEESKFRDRLEELQDLREGGTIGALEIQKMLEEEFDCNYSLSGVYTLLDRLNIVWITARSKHPKQASEAIEEFKIQFPLFFNEIQSFYQSKKIEVWWQDEARVGQRGTLSRQWANKGTRPRVVRQQQFISTYIFGAVCPERDKGCALILPETNAGMMQIHLNEISKNVAKGSHGILMMDRASWHTTETLKIPKNLSLMPLPAYSPELNPVEQIWQQLRRRDLSNRCFKGYDDIVDACSSAWNSFCDEEGNIKNLCTRDWAHNGT